MSSLESSSIMVFPSSPLGSSIRLTGALVRLGVVEMRGDEKILGLCLRNRLAEKILSENWLICRVIEKLPL